MEGGGNFLRKSETYVAPDFSGLITGRLLDGGHIMGEPLYLRQVSVAFYLLVCFLGDANETLIQREVVNCKAKTGSCEL